MLPVICGFHLDCFKTKSMCEFQDRPPQKFSLRTTEWNREYTFYETETRQGEPRRQGSSRGQWLVGDTVTLPIGPLLKFAFSEMCKLRGVQPNRSLFLIVAACDKWLKRDRRDKVGRKGCQLYSHQVVIRHVSKRKKKKAPYR